MLCDAKSLCQLINSKKYFLIMFTCPVCGAQFQYEDRLKVHMNFKHPDYDQKKAETTAVQQTETLEQYIRNHLKEDNVVLNAVDKFDAKPSEVKAIIERIKTEELSKNKPPETNTPKEEQTVATSQLKIIPKKFRITRKSDEKVIRIELGGKEYYEYLLMDFSDEMIHELGEEIINSIIKFLEKHKDENFTIVKEED